MNPRFLACASRLQLDDGWVLKKTHCPETDPPLPTDENNLKVEDDFGTFVAKKLSPNQYAQLAHGLLPFQPHFTVKDNAGKCVFQYQFTAKVSGGDLTKWFERGPGANLAQCKQIMHDTRVVLQRLVAGVLWMGENGYSHMDVHPSNILIKRDGTAITGEFNMRYRRCHRGQDV